MLALKSPVGRGQVYLYLYLKNLVTNALVLAAKRSKRSESPYGGNLTLLNLCDAKSNFPNNIACIQPKFRGLVTSFQISIPLLRHYPCNRTPWRFCALQVTYLCDISGNSLPVSGALEQEAGTSKYPDPRMCAPCIPPQLVFPQDLSRTASRAEWSLECSTGCCKPLAPFSSCLQFLSGQCPIMPSKRPCVLRAVVLWF